MIKNLINRCISNSNLSILNSLCYTVGWFWCVVLGIHGHPILAAIGAVLLILLPLYCTKIENVALYVQDLFLIAFSTILGIALEMVFIHTKMIQYINQGKMFPPIWIVLLYPLFSLLLNHSLKILKKSYLIAFLFGFLGAPLSYIAGRALGGLTFSYPIVHSWALIGMGWGVFLALLSKIANMIEKATFETFSERDSKDKLELLYDGECPICKREIHLLEKKDIAKKIKFVDISSKDFLPNKHHNIDYSTAMSQIHAINEKGTLLVGIPVFAAVYARCGLLVTSTLLRIPFLKPILKPFYTLFAKNRLWMTGRINPTKKS